MGIIIKDGVIYNSSTSLDGRALSTSIADEFSSTTSYVEGDRCMYEDELYSFTTSHSGDWDISDVQKVTIDDEIPKAMDSEDMSEIVTPLPSVMSRRMKYSTDEQVIGTWVDGKPLYQKTVFCGALPNNTTKTITHNIADIDHIINYFGISFASSSGATSLVLPYVHKTNISGQIAVVCSVSNIEIQTGMDRSSFTQTYVTIQYTKTTD